jgi:hypothetical protein
MPTKRTITTGRRLRWIRHWSTKVGLLGLLAGAVWFVNPRAPAAPQDPPPPSTVPAGAPLTSQQLDNLVAPIALYPDPLLGQTLAASTYPTELVEAEQWLKDHPGWSPSKRMKEAKKQNWDASVQGLVAFPDALARLTGDPNWTTQLGNAFLAQQADVMQAVQRMRAEAEARGTLRSTPQETVTTKNEGGRTAIAIEPADPDIWYVPNYNPIYVWGDPVWGYYPPLFYPGVGIGIGWFPGIDIGLYFGGWGAWGWGGWGWYPNWFGGTIFVDHSFFNRYGFHDYPGAGRLGSSAWVHNPDHRMGVPYPNREVAGRYARPAGGIGGRPVGGGIESRPGGRFGTPPFEDRRATGDHSVFGGYHDGGMTRIQSDRGFGAMGGGRTFGGFGGGGFGGGGFGGARGGGGRR